MPCCLWPGCWPAWGGPAGRRARVEARDEAAAIQLLTTVNLVAARGGDVDRVATEGLRELLAARVVRVVRADQGWGAGSRPRPGRPTAT